MSATPPRVTLTRAAGGEYISRDGRWRVQPDGQGPGRLVTDTFKRAPIGGRDNYVRFVVSLTAARRLINFHLGREAQAGEKEAGQRDG